MPEMAAMTAATAVRLTGLSKSFANGVSAAGPIDLAVARGEFVALLGPSGCGKSTLLRVIAGLIAPSSGSVVIEPTAHGAAASFGFVFQEPTLMPWATVAANVALPLRIAGRPRGTRQEMVEAALAKVGMADAAESFPHQLSGGMKMRASIARALVTDPGILLMDEPFAALDEITRFRLNDDLAQLAKAERKTVIFVTHSVFEAVYLAERIVVLSSRPARCFADIRIDAPRDRRNGFRKSESYAHQCGAVSDALSRAHYDGGGP
jgi:NitT/TauT family transport system ATP-binding protein